MSEKAYETKIKRLLTEVGAYHVKYFGCGFTQAGVPDILACIKGRFLAIEVKDVKGKPSPLQIHNVKKIRESGGLAIIAYPKDFEALKALIEALVNESDIKKSSGYFISQSFD